MRSWKGLKMSFAGEIIRAAFENNQLRLSDKQFSNLHLYQEDLIESGFDIYEYKRHVGYRKLWYDTYKKVIDNYEVVIKDRELISRANNQETRYEHLILSIKELEPRDEFLKRESEEKAKKQAKKEAMANSQYQGEIGVRDIFNLTLDFIGFYETEYGTVRVFNFTDENNNVFVWKSTTYIDLEIGNTYTLKGTVKEHKEYKGIKQTVLSRCKVID